MVSTAMPSGWNVRLSSIPGIFLHLLAPTQRVFPIQRGRLDPSRGAIMLLATPEHRLGLEPVHEVVRRLEGRPAAACSSGDENDGFARRDQTRTAEDDTGATPELTICSRRAGFLIMEGIPQ